MRLKHISQAAKLRPRRFSPNYLHRKKLQSLARLYLAVGRYSATPKSNVVAIPGGNGDKGNRNGLWPDKNGFVSMREALTILGFGPCHHMFEVMANEVQKRLWRALAKGAAPDWNQLFAGYASCIDWPSAHYWRDLIEFYPDAQVILTYRSPESWWKSFEKTNLAGIGQSTDQESLGLALISRQGLRPPAARSR